jgi:diacylglycerol O-acyltransferase / wax synthase
MRQLTSLDAQFLALEDGRNHSQVTAVSILDPATAPGGRLELDDVRRLVAERGRLLAPFRWRLISARHASTLPTSSTAWATWPRASNWP